MEGRKSDMLRMRKQFTERLQELHQRTLAKHSAMNTPELEEEAHAAWAEKQARKSKRIKLEGPRMTCPTCDAWLAAQS